MVQRRMCETSRGWNNARQEGEQTDGQSVVHVHSIPECAAGISSRPCAARVSFSMRRSRVCMRVRTLSNMASLISGTDCLLVSTMSVTPCCTRPMRTTRGGRSESSVLGVILYALISKLALAGLSCALSPKMS